MEDKDRNLLEEIKNAQNDEDKMNLMLFMLDERVKETAIQLLNSDLNKLVMASKLKTEAAKARVYGRLIKKEELQDITIKKTKELKSQRFAALVLDGMPSGNYVKKANVIADLFITSKEADDDTREFVSKCLKKIYRKMKMIDKDCTFLDFLGILENDYTIASVISNMAKLQNNSMLYEDQPIEGLPTPENMKDFFVAIKDENARKQIELIYSSKSELIDKLDASNIKKMNLPEDMTIGVELEAEGEISSFLNGVKLCDRWPGKSDASLENGIEVVSPILKDSIEDMTELALVCDIMKQSGLTTNERCGGHVHIGAKYLDSKKAFGNFLTLWLTNEENIYRMCNAAGESFRKSTSHFAKPISLMYEYGDEDILNNVLNAKTRDELVKAIKFFQRGHYNGLNTDNINREDNDTIEFRISNGTLNFEEIQNNIRLYGRLMQRAKEVSLIQSKLDLEEEISTEEQQKVTNFENLCVQDYTENEKGQMLIDFLFDEDERDIYIARYQSSRENMEPLKKMFSKEAYKKLYKDLSSKDKNFKTIIDALKDTKTNEKEITGIE